MSKRTLAILAALGATTIYGLNHTIAKGVMPHYVQPFGFIFLRVSGAALLFWLFSSLGPKQRIERKDWGRILVCAIFGMVINMLAFFKGLELSTPVNSAVLVTLTPIIVVGLSFFLIRERITLYKALGILLGGLGALGLIFLNKPEGFNAPNIPLGNTLFVVNATSYGLYLILAKKLIEKYHPLVLMKWLFTLAFIINFPITLPEFLEIPWAEIPGDGLAAIAFVILGTTFLTYLFNVFALTQLKASTVSAFIYAQPLIGIAFALLTGKDKLTLLNTIAMILVLSGVYLASRRPRIPPRT
ncbi:Permease of the drug/metabolite transporter (DMT) superfamily [Robiginitalea myxolifaciens]|uniref:Permease of the drug/metabolite transporter (DMT) superfamily n=1 Tax=Robiginitalea myxolifaciens TaxID=400055 RepID=A0A1I6G643_9FLAO|nr:DMT family transporter [Robiginitalea myxolifaciens]SFR37655.1 Permease of the drug/metabolite transporter (DMT) superfamily [Robiginitalea myxolifaciens]